MNEHLLKYKTMYKTEMCKNYSLLGKCDFGDKCTFAHTKNEINNKAYSSKAKTKHCIKFIHNGWCPYGLRCMFSHKYNSNVLILRRIMFNQFSKLEVFKLLKGKENESNEKLKKSF